MLKTKKLLQSENPTPILLRRLKDDHWEDKREKIIKRYEDPMPQRQQNVYNAIVERGKKAKGQKGEIFKIIHLLSKVSLYPSFQSEFVHDEISDSQFIVSSARINRLMSILHSINRDREKCLIFLQFRDAQDILAEIINCRFNHGAVPIIHGGIKLEERHKIVKSFQESKAGFRVMIISPKAGGFGINLTAATHVIHLTRWWNPAVEDQCTDRAYRIGQTSDVTVHYPMAIHPHYENESFDVILDNLIKRKREMNHAILAPTSLTDKELTETFGVCFKDD
jgi:SNF2 family DNA or RNA helicase